MTTPTDDRLWTTFYKKLAEAILAEYRNKENKPYLLLAKLGEAYEKVYRKEEEEGKKKRKNNNGEEEEDKERKMLRDITNCGKGVDPFSFLHTFNNSRAETADQNRIKFLTFLNESFHLGMEIPRDFTSLPTVPLHHPCFCAYNGTGLKDGEKVTSKQVNQLWSLFEVALDYANLPPDASEEDVKNARNKVIVEFNEAIWIYGNGTVKITGGLSWIAPNVFLNLSDEGQKYIRSERIPAEYRIPERMLKWDKKDEKNKDRRNKKKITAENYFAIMDKLTPCLQNKGTDFVALNLEAYENGKAPGPTPNPTPDPKPEPEPEPTPEPTPVTKPTSELPKYDEKKFLEQVFLPDDTQYEKLVHLLDAKKNIILQGPPGVGKTYAAKRLAWSILELPYSKDEDKCDDSHQIKFVQFHQSYSYEDFVEGYKPVGNNEFQLQNGIFRDFCDAAQEKEKDYIDNPDAKENKFFLIIDEINRGNTSKIFGELLMLIEKDHRGETAKLAYSKEDPEHPFYVPKNLFIIGMMNTADRSLAMIDYALRRRFAFFEMAPAFESKRFLEYYQGINGDKPLLTFEREKEDSELLNKLIGWVKELNDTIIVADKSLGDGFRIGHSYFCNWDECTLERMKNVVECDIVPTLEEYWFDNKEKVREALKGLPPALLPTKYSTSNT